jgi:hypothetical protein
LVWMRLKDDYQVNYQEHDGGSHEH